MSKFEGSAIVFMVVVGMVGWYFYWVKPQDELRKQISSCMSQAAEGIQHYDYDHRSLYEFCHSKVVQ